ncbi:serine hydrolase domain-containing protein [Hyphomonas sp.]|uniref:serine hydrolase domain-containing protein n=1 Tax=Hyphomonas sp. TaxID=87 RepID=UPI003527C9F1
MKHQTSAILSAVALFGLAACTTAPAAEPQANTFEYLDQTESPAGFSVNGLAELDAAMRKSVDDGKVKGISTLLVKDGEVINYDQYGIRRAADQAPIREDTIFRIYSMSKPVTGVALMTLYEDGAFSLDDPITKYVPELADLKVFEGLDEAGEPILVNADRPATMRELMSHTAGFAYGLFSDDPVNNMYAAADVLGAPDLETYISRLATMPLLYQPGTDWAYSTAVDVQGYIVQKLSGKRLGQYLEDEIFTPLGMVDTGFFVPEEKRDRFSDVFTPDAETGELVPIEAASFAFREGEIGMEKGGHGLVSTMGDYARFCQMLVNGGEFGGVRILKPETVELMRTNVLPEGVSLFSDGTTPNPQMTGQGFGLDFAIYVDSSAAGAAQPEGSYYWTGAAGTWFWIDPVNDLFFIGMVQRFPGGSDRASRKESADLVYRALAE